MLPIDSSEDSIMVDGSLDFSGGVNSYLVPTVASENNPNGLKRNQLSWLNNATVRGGGITQRATWKKKGNLPDNAIGNYQGSYMYEPDSEESYIISAISGSIWKIDPDHPESAINLSSIFKLTHPEALERYYFVQAEQFLVIQAGDMTTLPLIWDGSTLRRSRGLVTTGTPEIPSATCMDYFMGRLWYAQGRQYSAGDIVGNQASGTLAYNFRDSVLRVTENPLCIGGDGFIVPTNAGNIRAIKHSANINTQLGEGQLYIFTRRAVYSLTVPVTRNDWIAADTNNQPRQTVVQITNGSVNDRGVVEQNGDLFYQSLEPSVRSLFVAIRSYDQWGNTPISINEYRVLRFNDRNLMRFVSGVSFDNRMLQLAMPETCPVGVCHRAVMPLNFDVISTLENMNSRIPPVWEGMWEGLNFLELLVGDFGGLQRCFTLTWSDSSRNIQLWEITTAERFEKDDNRVVWYIEFPSFTWGDELMLKKLVGAELWIDRLYGEVMYQMDYRPDGDACWHTWHQWKLCTARTCKEDVTNPVCVYPTDYCESFRQTIKLPVPPAVCQHSSERPTTIGYQFQTRLIIKGFCRIRGLILRAEKVEEQMYGKEMVC